MVDNSDVKYTKDAGSSVKLFQTGGNPARNSLKPGAQARPYTGPSGGFGCMYVTDTITGIMAVEKQMPYRDGNRYPYKNNDGGRYAKYMKKSNTGGRACATMQKKEGTRMSYVCGLVNKNGVVFCSDSRSSWMMNGQLKEDSVVDGVRKVFEMDGYIVASFGQGEAVRDGVWVSISDVIESKRNRHVNRESFVDSMAKSLEETFQLDSTLFYEFYIGHRESLDICCIQHYIISAGGINKIEAVTRGMLAMENGWLAGAFGVDPEWDVSRMESAGKLMVRSVIDLSSMFLPLYSPVGGDIQCVSLS